MFEVSTPPAASSASWRSGRLSSTHSSTVVARMIEETLRRNADAAVHTSAATVRSRGIW